MKNKEQFSKQAWLEFAEATYASDMEYYFKEKETFKPNFEGFANLMEAVYNSNGAIESVLWKTVNPCGTEDRTWVRAYLAMCGNKNYKGIFRGLDGSHATFIKAQFDKVM